MTAPAPNQTQLPGAYFDIPGIPGGSTQWTEQDETTSNLATTMNSATSVQIQGIQPFRQTDVVSDWMLYLSIAATYTAGSSTLTASAYAPYNTIGQVQNLIQNQYASVDVENGIDLYIFSLARPFRNTEVVSGLNIGNNPAGDPVGGSATGYATAAVAQANQLNAAIWATASTAYNLILRIPAACWFDRYYDLLVTGEPTTQPHPALVSPQYMAGTTRNITPKIVLNAGNTATTDNGPVNIGAGSGTFAGTTNTRIRRYASYAGSPSTAPPVYAWQYRQKTIRFGVGGQSQFNLPLPLDTGQLMFCYVRMFDPLAAGALGAPINISTVTRINLQYGSGLLWLDAQTIGNVNAAAIMQRRWLSQHPSMLPPGVLGFDLATDDRGLITNARCLNTLTTAGIVMHLEFAAPLSAAAYAVLGTESLVYVS